MLTFLPWPHDSCILAMVGRLNLHKTHIAQSIAISIVTTSFQRTKNQTYFGKLKVGILLSHSHYPFPDVLSQARTCILQNVYNLSSLQCKTELRPPSFFPPYGIFLFLPQLSLLCQMFLPRNTSPLHALLARGNNFIKLM